MMISDDRKEKAERLFKEYLNPSHPRLGDVEHKILCDMKDRGYSPWIDEMTNAEFMLARYFRSEDKTKLFYLTVYVYDIGKQYPHHTGGVSLSPKSQFHLGDAVRRGPLERTVNVGCHTAEEDSLDQIEAFFLKFYNDMGCVPYETPDEF